MLPEEMGTRAMNIALSYMNGEGYWIPSSEAKILGEWILAFLQAYARAAAVSHGEGKPRWALLPKHHCLHHCALTLMSAEESGVRWCQNPMGTSNQMQEDFVGKPSRLSRRVSTQRLHERVMQRSLISAFNAIISSDKDDRGLM